MRCAGTVLFSILTVFLFGVPSADAQTRPDETMAAMAKLQFLVGAFDRRYTLIKPALQTPAGARQAPANTVLVNSLLYDGRYLRMSTRHDGKETAELTWRYEPARHRYVG